MDKNKTKSKKKDVKKELEDMFNTISKELELHFKDDDTGRFQFIQKIGEEVEKVRKDIDGWKEFSYDEAKSRFFDRIRELAKEVEEDRRLTKLIRGKYIG